MVNFYPAGTVGSKRIPGVPEFQTETDNWQHESYLQPKHAERKYFILVSMFFSGTQIITPADTLSYFSSREEYFWRFF